MLKKLKVPLGFFLKCSMSKAKPSTKRDCAHLSTQVRVKNLKWYIVGVREWSKGESCALPRVHYLQKLMLQGYVAAFSKEICDLYDQVSYASVKFTFQ